MKVVFVILHYESISDTIDCLESLLKYIDENQVEVIVVDNGSVNGKIDAIKEKYISDKVHFLQSSINLGFAKGNNIGYQYAKNVLNADIIILCNNDLVFEQTDFVEKLISHYADEKFDVAGPSTISLVDGKNQNPVPVQYRSITLLNKRIIKYYILYVLSYINMDIVIQRYFSKEIQEYHPNEQDEFQLFGACLIFANKYIDKFDGLYDKTFMYNEESILKERVDKCLLKMRYYKDLVVKHKEGASTRVTYGRGKEKRQFYYKWNIDSCLILRRIKKNREIIDKN